MGKMIYSGNLDYYFNRDNKFNKKSIDYIKIITSNDYDIDFFRRVDIFLTFKERQMLACMVRGKTIKEICGILNLKYQIGLIRVKKLIGILNRLYKFDKKNELSSYRKFNHYDRIMLICIIRRLLIKEGVMYMRKNVNTIFGKSNGVYRYVKDRCEFIKKIKSNNVEWYKLIMDLNN